jgi:hypothetical protein
VTSRFAEYDRKLGERRILVVDIERQAGLTHIFDQKTRGFISAARWTRLPSLLCLAAKWVDRKPIEFHAAWDDPAAMVEASWRLYDEADVVVGYNSVRFDNKWLRSEWRDAGMMPPRPWKDVDLYSVNRSLFGADSYSLAHLCKQLGLPSKSGHYDPVMADACMEGDEKAQRLMARYSCFSTDCRDCCESRVEGAPTDGASPTAAPAIAAYWDTYADNLAATRRGKRRNVSGKP